MVRDNGGGHFGEEVGFANDELLALLLGRGFDDDVVLGLCRLGLDGGRLAAFRAAGAGAGTDAGVRPARPRRARRGLLGGGFLGRGLLRRVLLLAAGLLRGGPLPAGPSLADAAALLQRVGAAFFHTVLVIEGAYRADGVGSGLYSWVRQSAIKQYHIRGPLLFVGFYIL